MRRLVHLLSGFAGVFLILYGFMVLLMPPRWSGYETTRHAAMLGMGMVTGGGVLILIRIFLGSGSDGGGDRMS
ncbi:MAG: hypothetical protein HQL57_09560 [Magnetococcales bacterium]|nr:hypothetical protein [Magnetococcales bacterium]